MSRSFLLTLLAVIAAASAPAQIPATPAPTSGPPLASAARPLWRCTLPGGTFEVAIGTITAVSTHEYVVDGVARVTELNIDTTGSLLARFYYLEPLMPSAPAGIGTATLEKAQQLLTEAADRSGQEHLWKKVVKNYPTTTHSRTVEYRLSKKEDVQKVFESAEEAFRTNQTKSFKID